MQRTCTQPTHTARRTTTQRNATAGGANRAQSKKAEATPHRHAAARARSARGLTCPPDRPGHPARPPDRGRGGRSCAASVPFKRARSNPMEPSSQTAVINNRDVRSCASPLRAPLAVPRGARRRRRRRGDWRRRGGPPRGGCNARVCRDRDVRVRAVVCVCVCVTRLSGRGPPARARVAVWHALACVFKYQLDWMCVRGVGSGLRACYRLHWRLARAGCVVAAAPAVRRCWRAGPPHPPDVCPSGVGGVTLRPGLPPPPPLLPRPRRLVLCAATRSFQRLVSVPSPLRYSCFRLARVCLFVQPCMRACAEERLLVSRGGRVVEACELVGLIRAPIVPSCAPARVRA